MSTSEMNGWDQTIEKAPIGVFRTNPKGRFLYANQALAKIFGYESPESLIEEVKDIAKDLLSNPKQREEVLALLNEHGHVRDFHYEAHAKDKTLRFVSFSARRVENEDPDSNYLEGFMHDVTEQRIAQDRLNRILTEIQGMAYRCKPTHPWDMEWVSDGCRELTGYHKQDLENQAPIYGDLIWGSHAKFVEETVKQAIEKNTTFTLVYPIRTAQGEKKWVFERGRAVRDDKGKVLRLEGVIQNYNEDRDKYARERHDAEIRNELQNQQLRRVMWWTVVLSYIAANFVILGVVIAKAFAGTVSDTALAAMFAATVGELAMIVFVIVRYVFPAKTEGKAVYSLQRVEVPEASLVDPDGPLPDDLRLDEPPKGVKPKKATGKKQ